MAGSEQTFDQHHAGDGTVQRKHRHEGPKNHLLAFALSILLTAIAFIAVVYSLEAGTHVEAWWVVTFIITLALFQAVIQLAFWMHMKDKGHTFPIIGIAFGFIVALTCVAAGVIWSWLPATYGLG